MPGLFEKILPKGAENAIKTDTLQRLLGMNDMRTLRKLISSERAAGAVILSSDKGYFLPDDLYCHDDRKGSGDDPGGKLCKGISGYIARPNQHGRVNHE